MSLTSIFQDIADSIRNKAKITNTMLPSEMPHYIDGIESGGSGIKAIEGTTTQQGFFNIETEVENA